MKKPSRFLRIVGVLGLLGTLVAALVGPAASASAQTSLPIPFDPDILFNFDGADFEPATNVIYYPWVANDDESTGLGPADTSITVQNLDVYGTQIYIFKGVGDGAWEYVTTAALAPWASKTFSAASLDIAEGEGAPIAVAGFVTFDFGDDVIIENELRELSVILSKPDGVAGDSTQVSVCVGYEIILDEEDEELTELYGFIAATTFTSDFTGTDVTYNEGEWVYPETQSDLQEILDDANAGADGDQLIDPFGGLNNDGSCDDYVPAVIVEGGEAVISAPIAGVAKQAVDGEELPYTSSADTAVSGYNAFNQYELASFDDWYLPIVQTNCGPGGCWNSILRVANLGNQNNAVTIRFFPADDGSGSLQTGFQLESLVDGGDVWHVDISDWVPEGWVGSAHIYSDGAVFAMVDRVKVGYNMWLTTTGSSAPAEAALQDPNAAGNYVLFAPDVRLDFFGWNTGINVANLADTDNNVNVQYFGQYGGTAQTLTQRLAPHGMTYFYDPSIGAQDNSDQDPTVDVNADLIGSALIWSDYPVAVAVDATKYPESTTAADANVFQGFTYNATANIYNWQFVPLVQKGNPTTGQGATSGIQIFNPNSVATQANVYWVNQSGFQADNFGGSSLAVPAYANGFVYTMTQHNLPNGYYGAAVVESSFPILALSTNVDYQVQFDGSASWLAFNPCGFYRTPGPDYDGDGNPVFDCSFGNPIDQPAGGSITKIFTDADGDPVAGVEVVLVNATNGWVGEGVSSVNGEILWTNMPPGEYMLFVVGGPEAFIDEDLVVDGGPYYQYYVDQNGNGVLDAGEEIGSVYWDDVDEDGVIDEGEEYLGADDYFELAVGEDVVIENDLGFMGAVKIVETGVADLDVCVYADTDGDGDFDEDDGSGTDEDIDEEVVCGTTDADGDVIFENLDAGDYFIVVGSLVFGPETFEAGGVYLNDLTQDIAATGVLTKVLTFPESQWGDGGIVEGIRSGAYSLNSEVIFCEGQITDTTLCDDAADAAAVSVGGYDDAGAATGGVDPTFIDGFIYTDRVPVGEYTICTSASVTGDFDADGDDETIQLQSFRCEFATTGDVPWFGGDEGRQALITPPYNGTFSDPFNGDIVVYEDTETRVWNLATDAIGQFDVFVRDEVTDLPLEGAEVCVYDAEGDLVVACELTGANGYASFDLPGATYTVNASADGYESQAGVVAYDVFEDAANGGLDDTGDATGSTADGVIALDPAGAVLDVQTVIGTTPVNGIEVSLYAASPLDDVAAGVCGSTDLLALATTGSDSDSDGSTTEGVAEFGVEAGVEYCVSATIAGDPVAASPVVADPDDPDTDIDVTLAADFDPATQGVLDVTVVAAAVDAQTGVHPVDIHIADPTDTAGDGGTCAGALVTSGVTAPNATGDGEVDFILAANTYCVAASSADGLGTDPTVVTNVALAAGDPPNDVDVTVFTS